jgi:hypothetical protein
MPPDVLVEAPDGNESPTFSTVSARSGRLELTFSGHRGSRPLTSEVEPRAGVDCGGRPGLGRSSWPRPRARTLAICNLDNANPTG